MGSALYALVGTAILRGTEEFFGGSEESTEYPRGHGSGVILSDQIPGSEILVIRVVLEVQLDKTSTARRGWSDPVRASRLSVSS